MIRQSGTTVRPRSSSSPDSYHCRPINKTKNHRFAAAVVTMKNYQTKRRREPSPVAVTRSRRTAPRVRFSHPLVQALRIPRIDDEETKNRLYYSSRQIAFFTANERVRRQVLSLTVALYKEQIKRIIQGRQLMPAYLVVAIFQKMFSRFGMIAASATTTSCNGGASKATRKIRATTNEMANLDDSSKRPTKRCRVGPEATNARQSSPNTAPGRMFARCA